MVACLASGRVFLPDFPPALRTRCYFYSNRLLPPAWSIWELEGCIAGLQPNKLIISTSIIATT